METKEPLIFPPLSGDNIKHTKKSGIGESNPFHSLGKAGHGRYTNPA